LIAEKIPLIRCATNFASNPLIRRYIFLRKPTDPGAKTRFSLFFARWARAIAAARRGFLNPRRAP